jgi:predicted 3-demethylubiquinone-9 3-methyltransferase (glyoxalase superfamily)
MKITPFLWLESGAEEAAKFYCSIFKGSRITHTDPMTVAFSLAGNDFVALNGGPLYKPTPAVSFVVPCETQGEIDHYWSNLSGNGGQESQCGWLVDRYGISWQIVPHNIGKLVASEPARAAMMKMKKLDLKTLEQAAKT